jgi:hypothetical protein
MSVTSVLRMALREELASSRGVVKCLHIYTRVFRMGSWGCTSSLDDPRWYKGSIFLERRLSVSYR